MHQELDTPGVVNIVSNFQVPSSYDLVVKVLDNFFTKDEKVSYFINQWNNDEGDFKTAPATMGLLIMNISQ